MDIESFHWGINLRLIICIALLIAFIFIRYKGFILSADLRNDPPLKPKLRALFAGLVCLDMFRHDMNTAKSGTKTFQLLLDFLELYCVGLSCSGICYLLCKIFL